MKAPDKIYVHELSATELDLPIPYGVSYIRKDAILEWARKQKEETEGLIKEHSKDDSLWAEMHWYERLINHIESL